MFARIHPRCCRSCVSRPASEWNACNSADRCPARPAIGSGERLPACRWTKQANIKTTRLLPGGCNLTNSTASELTQMRVLIATTQVPFIQGGAELLATGLRQALIAEGHEAEI